MNNERELVRYFQRIKSFSLQKFIEEMNVVHSSAYMMGQKNVFEAMATHPRISKPMIREVEQKAAEIRELWDGLRWKETEGSTLE